MLKETCDEPLFFFESILLRHEGALTLPFATHCWWALSTSRRTSPRENGQTPKFLSSESRIAELLDVFCALMNWQMRSGKVLQQIDSNAAFVARKIKSRENRCVGLFTSRYRSGLANTAPRLDNEFSGFWSQTDHKSPPNRPSKYAVSTRIRIEVSYSSYYLGFSETNTKSQSAQRPKKTALIRTKS